MDENLREGNHRRYKYYNRTSGAEPRSMELGEPKYDSSADYDPLPSEQAEIDEGIKRPNSPTYSTARKSEMTIKGQVSKEPLTEFM